MTLVKCEIHSRMIMNILNADLKCIVHSSSQESSSFSFRECLPSGWEYLLFSGVATFIFEKIYLDRDDFWATFFVHFSFGFACFSVTAFAMWVLIYALDIVLSYHFLLVLQSFSDISTHDSNFLFSLLATVRRDCLSEKLSVFASMLTETLEVWRWDGIFTVPFYLFKIFFWVL